MNKRKFTKHLGLGTAGLLLSAIMPAAAAVAPVHRGPAQRYEAPVSGTIYPVPGTDNRMSALVGPDGRPNAAGAAYELDKSAHLTH
jgi:hypothetical protein